MLEVEVLRSLDSTMVHQHVHKSKHLWYYSYVSNCSQGLNGTVSKIVEWRMMKGMVWERSCSRLLLISLLWSRYWGRLPGSRRNNQKKAICCIVPTGDIVPWQFGYPCNRDPCRGRGGIRGRQKHPGNGYRHDLKTPSVFQIYVCDYQYIKIYPKQHSSYFTYYSTRECFIRGNTLHLFNWGLCETSVPIFQHTTSTSAFSPARPWSAITMKASTSCHCFTNVSNKHCWTESWCST